MHFRLTGSINLVLLYYKQTILHEIVVYNTVVLEGMGKRGGARVIYYYRNEQLPIFLLSAYAKNTKDNLSKAERNQLKKLVADLVAGYPRRR